jgi:hypothetical protein
LIDDAELGKLLAQLRNGNIQPKEAHL